MADIVPTAGYDSVPLLEYSDKVEGRATGESVALGQLRPDNKQAYRLLNNIEALKAGKISGPSNCVLSALSSSFTVASNILTIDGSSDPIVFSFANGINAFGMADTVVKFTGTNSTLNFASASSGDQFDIFAVWNGTAISFVKIQLTGSAIPKYQTKATAPGTDGTDKFYFNTTENQMYREVSSAWVAVQAIYIGGVRKTVSASFSLRPTLVPAYESANPAGTVCVWHGSGIAIPPGWLLCDGSTVFECHYQELANVIGVTYGGALPVLNLPDFTGETLNGTSIEYIIKAY